MSSMTAARIAIVGVFLLLLTGCPGSDPLTSSYTDVTIELEVVNDTSASYDSIDVVVAQVILSPFDPTNSIGRNFAVISRQIPLNLARGSGITPLVLTNLPFGSYQLESITLRVDRIYEDNQVATPTECIENFDELPPLVQPRDTPTSTVIVPVSQPASLIVNAADDPIRIQLDYQGVIDAVLPTMRTFCRETTSCNWGGGRILSPPCIANHSWSGVNAELVDVISVTQ